MARARVTRRFTAGARMALGRISLPSRSGTRGIGAQPEDWDSDLAADGLAIESRLVWMLGSPRTGSTWLLRLMIHPWVLAKRSPTGLRAPVSLSRRRGPDVVPIDESYLLHHLTPLEVPPYKSDHQEDPEEFTLNAQRNADPAYFFAESFEASWRPALRRLVLARLGAQARLAAERHRLTDPLVVVKEPNGSQGADVLMRILPRSRLLFLLRDGRDVVDSMLDARSAGGFAAGAEGGADPANVIARRDFVLRQSRIWLANTLAVERAYHAHPPDLRLLVRYEDLRESTETELGRICAWLGLGRSEGEIRAAAQANAFEAIPGFMKGPGKPQRSATPGLWREHLSAEEQGIMERVMGPKLAELGYAT